MLAYFIITFLMHKVDLDLVRFPDPPFQVSLGTRLARTPSSSWGSSLPGFTVSVNDSMNQQLCCNGIMRRHLKNNFGGCQ